jgi:hypothetical protein
MHQFHSIEQLDTGILYLLELASSLSVLLLAFGLITSMANVLTKGSVLTDNLFMQRVWAWTQCIAIDASVAGTIIRTFRYYAKRERVKYILYGFLSLLLLFTAAIVSTIESVQLTLNIALDTAYVHVFIPVEVLIWIRSLAIVLLIVAHALRHVQLEPEQSAPVVASAPQLAPLVLTPELIDALRAALAQVTVSEEPETLQSLPSTQCERQASEDGHRANAVQESRGESDDEQGSNNYGRVKRHIALFPRLAVFQRSALAFGNGTSFAVHRGCSCQRGSPLHHEAQGSQDALTHFVIPRSTLPLLHGQFKSLGRIFCEECRHVLGKLCTIDRDIDFIVPDQAQTIEIACSDR